MGYDAAEAAYFHRELPYRVGQAELHNPRLRDARALVLAGAVTVDGETASVHSGDAVSVRSQQRGPSPGHHKGRKWRPVPDILDHLTEIARIGAHTTAWNIPAGAQHGLLSGSEPARRLGALLAPAADCASTSGATGNIPELDAIADRTGSPQPVKQARRPRQILT